MNVLSLASPSPQPHPMVRIEPQGGPIDLHEGQHLTLLDAAGTVAKTVYGSLWITEEGSLRDVVLQAGDRFTLERPGLTVISAMLDTRVYLYPAPDSH